MKIVYSKTIKIFLFSLSIIACKAQTYPLNTDFTSLPNNSYLKDLDNELITFVGTFKAIFQGNEITLFINKENDKLIPHVNKKYYSDVLAIKYIVKSSKGKILQNTQNMIFDNNQIQNTIYSFRTRPAQNKLLLYYGGTNCSVGYGKIILNKINSTQLSWEYRANDIILDDDTCPGNPNLTIYLPETNGLIFTKQ